MEEFIKEEIKKLCFKKVDIDDELFESGILDSITAVDLAVALEEKYNIKIPFVDINEQHFKTINAMVNYLQIKTKA